MLYLLLLLSITIPSLYAAVIGIDLGSQYVKVAMVKPGLGFEIVPDEQTRRKFPSILTFDTTGERLYGNSASSLSLKRPQNSYFMTSWLLGKPYYSPKDNTGNELSDAVKLYKSYYFPNELVNNNGTIGYQHNSTTIFSSELIQSMILAHVKSISTTFATSPVKDCVITVPIFYSQKERQSVINAAELAGLNVLTLINENTAAALQYAINYDFNVNKTANVIFYNMGSSSTQVSLFKYSASMKAGKVVGNVETLAASYDETLGGLAFDLYLAEEFLKRFSTSKNVLANKITKEELVKNPRVMARLRDTANRIKEILSANKEAPVYTESLYKDIDFVSLLNQEDFNKLVDPLYSRVTVPLEKVLSSASLAQENIDQFVLIGGGTRIPKIQTLLKTFMKRESLEQNINGDEAAAFGASFRAANLSLSFRVRAIGLTELTLNPVGVRFSGEENFAKRASIFSPSNAIDRKKVVSFPLTHDVQSTVFYDSADYLPTDATTFLGNYSITGMAEVAKKQAKLSAETPEQKPKVSFTFQFNPSSIIELTSAEASLEETIKVPVVKKVNTTKVEKKEDEKTESDATNTEEAAKGETSEASKATETPAEPEVTEYTTRKKTHKIALQVTRLDTVFGAEEKASSLNTLKLLAEFDKHRRDLADSFNALESFLYATRDKLAAAEYDDESDIARVTTVAQRKSMSGAMDAASNWLSEHEVGSSTTTEEYREQLSTLKTEWALIDVRLRELILRPDAIAEGHQALNISRLAAASIRKDKPWLNETEVARLDTLIDTAEKWFLDVVKKQDETPLTSQPVFMSNEIPKKMLPLKDLALQLHRRVKPVEKKAAPKKPKAKKPKAAAKDKDGKVDETKIDAEADATEEAAESTEETSKEGEESKSDEETKSEDSKSEESKDKTDDKKEDL